MITELGLFPNNGVKMVDGGWLVYNDLFVSRDGKFYWRKRPVSRSVFMQLALLYNYAGGDVVYVDTLMNLFPLSTSKYMKMKIDGEWLFGIKNGQVVLVHPITTPLWEIVRVDEIVQYDATAKRFVPTVETDYRKLIIHGTPWFGRSVSKLVQTLENGFYIVADFHEGSKRPANTELELSLMYLGQEVFTTVLDAAPLEELYTMDLSELVGFKRVRAGEYRVADGVPVYCGKNYASFGEKPEFVPEGWFTVFGEHNRVSVRRIGNYTLEYHWDDNSVSVTNFFGNVVKTMSGQDLLSILPKFDVGKLVDFMSIY